MRYKVEYRECSITEWHSKLFFTKRGAEEFIHNMATRIYDPFEEFALYNREAGGIAYSYKKCKDVKGWVKIRFVR